MQLGYALYNPTYALGSNLLDKWANSWSANQPVYQGESEVLEFYWYVIDSATQLAAAATAALTLFALF